MYENKKILIIGAGKSGIAIAKLLSNYNNDITLCDISPLNEDIKNDLESLNVKLIICENQEELIDDSWDIIIKNPAVMSTSKIIKKCEKLNLRVENEMEVAYHFLPKNLTIIGVTGSNGKTTTTTIIYEILKRMGKSVIVGGNIGTPLTMLLPSIKENDILLLEISDHQLCDFHDFKTDISVITNICPTHLDYHGTYEHYKNTKAKIFNNHTLKDLAIINKDNEDAFWVSVNVPSKKVYFSNKDFNCECFYKDGYIYVDGKKAISQNEIKLVGVHNIENIMAALLVIKEFDWDISIIKDFLQNFGGVEHRIEYVKQIDGVKYFNDSKSTNPTSTITALKTFSRPIHLILGGLNRNQDYHELDNYMENVVFIYAIGETTLDVYDYAKEINKNCVKCYTLKTALENIKKNVKNGDIVLLSPGSSSQDQYPHFEDRGNEFKNELEKF